VFGRKFTPTAMCLAVRAWRGGDLITNKIFEINDLGFTAKHMASRHCVFNNLENIYGQAHKIYGQAHGSRLWENLYVIENKGFI